MSATFQSLGQRFLARFKRSAAGRSAYLQALADAMLGLPAHVVVNTLADYEHRFAEGAVAGRSEAEIAAALPDPRTVAAQCRASLRQQAFSRRKTMPNLWRLFIALVGLAIVNLFLVIPALVFGALLFAFFSVALAVYVGGVALTASGISGVNEIHFDAPHHAAVLVHEHEPALSIDRNGLDIATPAEPSEGWKGLSISTDIGDYSRGAQTAGGIAMIAGGILMLLLGLLIGKYTVIGVYRYLMLNYTLLRNA